MSTISDLTLGRSPIQTLALFAKFLRGAAFAYTQQILRHPVTLYIALPLLVLYFVANNLAGSHQDLLTSLELEVSFVVWWLGLGILSSVGLGTGAHTGILFLFPHIMKICLATTECRSTDFNSKEMWFTQDDTLFVCRSKGSGVVLFSEVFLKVFWPCFLWGSGTAIGEIPPYAISFAAAKAGKSNTEFDELQNTKSDWALFDKMKTWMINFLQNHGFVGIILMSAWPNAAFDLCGICCGHFMMPFWSFFIATWIGKALIKVNLQACFFVTVFTEDYLVNTVDMIEKIIPDALDPCVAFAQKGCHEVVADMFYKARATFQVGGADKEGGGSWLKTSWNIIIFCFIGYFVISCIEQFAQLQAREDLETKKKTK